MSKPSRINQIRNRRRIKFPVYNSILDLVGNTPIIQFSSIGKNLPATLFGKVELFNPTGSIKVRIAKSMIEQAETEGMLKKGMTIIEPSSGNTGIGLALVGHLKNYKVKIIMPEDASIERQKIMRALGAEVILTGKNEGMQGAIALAKTLRDKSKNIFLPMQFNNPANPEIHQMTTAQEIWKDMKGKIDVFVAAVGTGGTITGVGKALKKLNPKIKIIAIEPSKSRVLSGGEAHPHKIQGMGAGFIPPVLNMDIIDKIIAVTEEEAYSMTRDLALHEGLFVGISSGAAVCAALKYAQEKHTNQNIVVILPDTGDRYLSTDLWE